MLSKDKVQGLSAKVWCSVWVLSKIDKQGLGAWLGAKRKDKKQRVRSKDNKLRLGYTLYHKPKAQRCVIINSKAGVAELADALS